MPLGWDQIQNSPVYQGMPPEQQQLARQQYMSQSALSSQGQQPVQQGAQQPAVNASDWPDEYQTRLAQYPAQIQPIIKGVIDGRTPPDRTHLGMNPGAILAAVNNVDPTFDTASPTARMKTAQDFSSAGKSGQTITSLNTASRHGAQLALNMLDENNRSLTPWNYVANQAETMAGNPNYTNAQAVLNMYAPEAAKVAHGVGSTAETAVQQMKDGIPLNGSPVQQLGALANTNDILLSKAEELQNTYNDNMGKVGSQKQVVNPHALSALNDINDLYGHAQAGTLDSPEAQLTKAKLKQYVQWYDKTNGQAQPSEQPSQNTQPMTIPSMEQRQVGQTYQTPKGPMTWQGQGWLPAGGGNAAP